MACFGHLSPEPGPGSIINGRSSFAGGPGLDYRPDSPTGRPFYDHVEFCVLGYILRGRGGGRAQGPGEEGSLARIIDWVP